VIDPILQSTYLRGSKDDVAFALAIAGRGDVYVAGYSTSTDFPNAAGGAQPANGGSYGAFVARLSADLVGAAAATPDHFFCYKVKTTKGAAKFAKIPGIDLGDQFEGRKFDLTKPVTLCNPADKNGEGVSDIETHLEGYQVKLSRTDPAQPKFVKRTNIRVTNQFGGLVVDVVKPDRLLVPTAKSLQGPVDPPDPQGHEVDHFKCYKLKARKNVCLGDPAVRCKTDDDCGQASPCVGKFPQDLQVTLEDQFTTTPRLYLLTKPAKLCAPVDKNGEGMKKPDNRLMCYQVKLVKKTCQVGSPQHALGAGKREKDCGGVEGQTAFCVEQPEREKVVGIHTNNQFGPEVLDAGKELELCVPSVKTLPGGG